MSGRAQDIDLASLARPAGATGQIPPPRRRWLWVLVPAVLLAGFAWVVLESARLTFADPIPVTVVRPRPAAHDSASAGSALLQAAGWVEPDPFPVRIPALAAGVIETMLVQESDVLRAGDPVCELVAEDARLALEMAEADLSRAHAEHTAAVAEFDNALASFEAALDVTEGADAAEADTASRSAELGLRQAAVEQAQALVDIARNELETQRFLVEEQATGPWQLELATARLDEARARVRGLEAEALRAAADLGVSQAHQRRAEADLELRLEEHLRIDLARASTKRTEAQVQAAASRLRAAQLRLFRMTVRSPVDGVVLTRDAYTGSTVGPGAVDPAVCHLYDPTSLRVRLDVPQGQVAGASVGQRAEIRSNVRRDLPYTGTVLRIVESADIQKVTLEVQVRIDDPDGLIKPDMLCQVTLYGVAPDTGSAATETRAVTIPARCLVEAGSVWVVDATTGLAARRSVRTGDRDGDDILVLEGLNISDKVLDGGRVEVTAGARLQIGQDQ